jgi:hypothetical protein
MSDHPVRDAKEWKYFIDIAATPPQEEGNQQQHHCWILIAFR